MNKYIMMFVAAIALVSCSDDLLETPSTPVEAGAEVQFGLSLEGTRTVYGPKGATAYPIYWTEGDKVQIYSPDCLEGRNNAEYKVVIPKNAENETVTDPDYADELQKTGPYGIQWGEKATAKFYSLYPSGNYKMSADRTKAEGLNIAYTQNVYVNEDKENVTSLMEECFMYAQSDDVEKGKVVNLQYKPVTTTFMLTLKVPKTSKDDFIIQNVSLTAPTGTYIAGDFSINITDGSFGGWGTNKSNSVAAQIYDKATGGFFTLAKENEITIPLFIAPATNLNIDGWYVTVATNLGTYKKTLYNSDTKNKDGKVNAGEVHCITLPNLATEVDTEWDVANWMKNIPRNVYLSEVSIPGTWNSLNIDCQSVTDIEKQYGNGVRAFHLDTRWRADNKPLVGSTFTGISNPTITELSIAVGGSNKTYKYDDANLMRKGSASTFAEYLKLITDNVKPDEYMVVFVTFAHNSYNGDRRPSTWYEAVSNACATNEKVYDASKLTQNTLVGDVLNSVIVVVNLDASVDTTTLPANSRCLFTYVPMNLPQYHYGGDPEKEDDTIMATADGHIDALYYGSKTASGISMHTSHAQISTTNGSAVNCSDRGYSHPLAPRDALVESIWDWSKDNYGKTESYNHDKWIYLGLGGYILNTNGGNGSGYDTIEARYAPKIYERIESMGKNNVPFYPVGIILMNNKVGGNYTTGSGESAVDLGYNFSGVCKEILLLNNKYRLQYDSTKPSDYNPNALQQADYDGSLTNGGNAIQ